MKMSWLPGNYQAAIAITDDPDNSSFESFKTMYDFLLNIDFPTTRAMWVYNNSEPTGTPPLQVKFTAPLLSELECLKYCKELSRRGFEICLHGASCGNNNRIRMIDALNFLSKEIAWSPMYICHSKNAENLYWDSKTANSNLEKKILQMYTKNRCFGEIADSQYFWGDICREKINFIRMFRTRSLNTLNFNPSMPYHDFSKPFVNYWFSATKGYIPTLFTEANINSLCEQNGVSILYQYLHKYVDFNNSIQIDVKNVLEKIANDKRILKKPASYVLQRLKQMQNIQVINHNDFTYLLNTSNKAVESVQIHLLCTDYFCSESPHKFDKIQRTVIFDSIAPYSMVRFKCSDNTIANKIPFILKDQIAVLEFPKAIVYANLSPDIAYVQTSMSKFPINAWCIFVKYKTPEAQRLEILREITSGEITRLKMGQMSILLREHLLLGRKFTTKEYLKTPGKIEDLSNW
jgi:hypothetical protein